MPRRVLEYVRTRVLNQSIPINVCSTAFFVATEELTFALSVPKFS
eukprot:SAG31_NODE_480_length_15108_cov_56.073423_17_plen_45_part_00